MITAIFCTAICTVLIFMNEDLRKERDEMYSELIKAQSRNEYLEAQAKVRN
jgi:hypothetical protein